MNNAGIAERGWEELRGQVGDLVDNHAFRETLCVVAGVVWSKRMAEEAAKTDAKAVRDAMAEIFGRVWECDMRGEIVETALGVWEAKTAMGMEPTAEGYRTA